MMRHRKHPCFVHIGWLGAMLLLVGCQAPTTSLNDLAQRVDALEVEHEALDDRITTQLNLRGLATRGYVEQVRQNLSAANEKQLQDTVQDLRRANSQLERRLDQLEAAIKRDQSNASTVNERLARRLEELDRQPREMAKDIDAIRHDYRALYAKLDEMRMQIFKRMDLQYHQIEEGRMTYARLLEEERKLLRGKLAELDRAIDKLNRELPPATGQVAPIAPATRISETRASPQR